MENEDMLNYKDNIFSQNGEDRIIQYIFNKIGTQKKICCEFGAWDGIHFSNCRNLILQGWTAVMIEGDYKRYNHLVKTYKNNPSVKAINRYVDTTNNRLENILYELEISSLDFLSIDIDGLDYQIFESMEMLPRVVCIEVGAGHDPRNQSCLPADIAKDNIGQPLPIFVDIAKKKGYNLICYTGNAFFIRQEICQEYSIPSFTSEMAYASYLAHLNKFEKEWLYLANLGIVPPYHKFNNVFLNPLPLGISRGRSIILRLTSCVKQFVLRKARIIINILR